MTFPRAKRRISHKYHLSTNQRHQPVVVIISRLSRFFFSLSLSIALGNLIWSRPSLIGIKVRNAEISSDWEQLMVRSVQWEERRRRSNVQFSDSLAGGRWRSRHRYIFFGRRAGFYGRGNFIWGRIRIWDAKTYLNSLYYPNFNPKFVLLGRVFLPRLNR